MFDSIKQFVLTKLVPFITTYVVRWSLKFVGSVLLYIGWEQSQYTEFVAGVLTFLFGIILSLLFDKKK